MADTIPCTTEELCNCVCNCAAYTTNGRVITVGDLVIDGNDYTFTYTITNQDPAISFVVFCIQCPTNVIEISDTNTSIVVTGNPSGTPVGFTECFTPGCESAVDNQYYVEYNPSNEPCCKYQAIKIDVNPADTITEIEFQITFTLPEGVVFGFNAGNLKLKVGEVIEIVNDLCMPGCIEACNLRENICELWLKEKTILESNQEVFVHFSQLLFPPELDLGTLTIQELESKIRSLAKLQNSAACLICSVAKVLDKLNELYPDGCYSDCTQCI